MKKTKSDPIFISSIFWRWDRKWAFQKAGKFYELYDCHGEFVKEFRSFKAMHEYMDEHGKEGE